MVTPQARSTLVHDWTFRWLKEQHGGAHSIRRRQDQSVPPTAGLCITHLTSIAMELWLELRMSMPVLPALWLIPTQVAPMSIRAGVVTVLCSMVEDTQQDTPINQIIRASTSEKVIMFGGNPSLVKSETLDSLPRHTCTISHILMVRVHRQH